VLKQHQIDAVIDIRLHNEGKYYRFKVDHEIWEAMADALGAYGPPGDRTAEAT
jgi:hypothetical protein